MMADDAARPVPDRTTDPERKLDLSARPSPRGDPSMTTRMVRHSTPAAHARRAHHIPELAAGVRIEGRARQQAAMILATGFYHGKLKGAQDETA